MKASKFSYEYAKMYIAKWKYLIMTFHYYVISRRLIIHAHGNECLGGLQLCSSAAPMDEPPLAVIIQSGQTNDDESRLHKSLVCFMLLLWRRFQFSLLNLARKEINGSEEKWKEMR